MWCKQIYLRLYGASLCCAAGFCLAVSVLPSVLQLSETETGSRKLLRQWTRKSWAMTACFGRGEEEELGRKDQQLQLPAVLCEILVWAVSVVFVLFFVSFHGPGVIALFCSGKLLQNAFFAACLIHPSITIMSVPMKDLHTASFGSMFKLCLVLGLCVFFSFGLAFVSRSRPGPLQQCRGAPRDDRAALERGRRGVRAPSALCVREGKKIKKIKDFSFQPFASFRRFPLAGPALLPPGAAFPLRAAPLPALTAPRRPMGKPSRQVTALGRRRGPGWGGRAGPGGKPPSRRRCASRWRLEPWSGRRRPGRRRRAAVWAGGPPRGRGLARRRGLARGRPAARHWTGERAGFALRLRATALRPTLPCSALRAGPRLPGPFSCRPAGTAGGRLGPGLSWRFQSAPLCLSSRANKRRI